MSELSDWLKECRRKLEYTQAQMATRIGVHQAQLSVMENGKSIPNIEIMNKFEAIFGKFKGSYVPVQPENNVRGMSDKAKEALRIYREAKENGFNIQIDDNLFITADRNQYILKQGIHTSYFTQLKSLIKFLVTSQVRQSAINTVQEMSDKLDNIYKLIESKFDNYNPANLILNEDESI